MLYEAPSRVDGYVRDACVFREDIDIPDTMTATIRYANGVQVVIFASTPTCRSRAFISPSTAPAAAWKSASTTDQPWADPSGRRNPADAQFRRRSSASGWPSAPGGHFGGDDGLRDMLFKPGVADPLGQRAGARAGAVSVLCGLAALESMRTKRVVSVQEIWGGPLPD